MEEALSTVDLNDNNTFDVFNYVIIREECTSENEFGDKDNAQCTMQVPGLGNLIKEFEKMERKRKSYQCSVFNLVCHQLSHHA
jgi:hypothetical protein